ncbi:hypothetical protein DQ04_01251050 [Trypanosoma grayi]|uniref:hypothetical protein n=1 Tax=Trypanosoma grayi TaxID=71804 RepID=UPI0004F4A79B|nr:hypothetical protein DQ04_01251050 [Trypanosoma grayi]KEG13032.1 hypothetical protein DQ04_01251050 [Trypanosoma grayi]
MSGLWSFSDVAVPHYQCMSGNVRKSLPTAADDSFHSAPEEIGAASLTDPMTAFSLTADVDGAIQDAQNEWLERTVGAVLTSPYHLRLHQHEALNVASAHREDCVSRGDGCGLLDAEDMAVVRSLLKLKVADDTNKGHTRTHHHHHHHHHHQQQQQEQRQQQQQRRRCRPAAPAAVVRSLLKLKVADDTNKGHTRTHHHHHHHQQQQQEQRQQQQQRRRCRPAAPAPLVLHTAEIASRRGKSRNFDMITDGGSDAMSVEAQSNVPNGRGAQEIAQPRHIGLNAKHAPEKVRLAPPPVRCGFVERMERRAAQRRAARSALGAARVLDSSASALPTAQGVPSPTGVQTALVSLGDALPLEVLDAFVSMEIDLADDSFADRGYELDRIARQWHSVQLKRVVWRRWRRFKCSQAGKGVCNTDPVVVSITDDRAVTEVLQDVRQMRLLRWYFVLWVAFVEATRNGCIAVS